MVMTAKVLSPQETHSLLSNNSESVYIDVRTVAEFATGHPRGRVVNIPILFRHPTKEETYPNQSFLTVVEDMYPKEMSLVVGCGKETRALQAVEQLVAAGYSNVATMQGGYSGWKDNQLPTTKDNRDGISYVSLLMKVKRKGKKKAAH
jgi:rhodanese-related sulfurtransferase